MKFQAIALSIAALSSMTALADIEKPTVKKNADGTVEMTYTLPKGSTEGVYIANQTNVFVVKPSKVLAELGVETNDRIISACGKDMDSPSLSSSEKLKTVALSDVDECVLKISRKESVLYVSYKKKPK